MLIAGAVCPHPPLLIPAAGGAAAGQPAPEMASVTEACDRAVHSLLTAEPDLIAVVGGAPSEREYPAGAAGSLRAYGVDVTVGTGEPVLPLSLTIGRWLLDRALAGLPDHLHPPLVVWQAVESRAAPADCRKLGMLLAERAPRVAMLAMGDASARRARDTPLAPDPEAQEYDDEVAEALAAADVRWLSRLDPRLDGRYLVAGRAAWQVLAGAAVGRRLHGRLLCMTAPYGVTYLVAAWEELG